MAGVDAATMRRLNTSVVLQTVLDEPLTTIASVTAATALSRRTVEVILESLVESGWMRRVEDVPPTGVGRPARVYRFVPENGAVLTMHFDYLATVAAVADVRGRILQTARVGTAPGIDRAGRIRAGREAAAACLSSAGIPVERVRRVVIGTPGTVDEGGVVSLKLLASRSVEGELSERRVAFSGWDGFSLSEAYRGEFACPIDVENDINLSALAEQWIGATRDDLDSVWLVAGSFVGAGIIINGELYRGYRGRAGEFVNAAGLGLDRLGAHPLGMLTSPFADQRRAAVDLLGMARAGDADALEQLRTFTAVLGGVVATLGWILSPSTIVLGGELAEQSELLLPAVARIVAERGPDGVSVRPSALAAQPHDPTLLGAVKLGIDGVRAQLLGHGAR